MRFTLTGPVAKLPRRITRSGFDGPINAAVGKRTLRIPFTFVHRTRFLASGRDCSMPLDTSGASAAF
jgi:hypothetical protein